MKEPKLNEVFEHEGKTLKCVEFESCGHCDFLELCNTDFSKTFNVQLACSTIEREDRYSVMFVEVKS